ncbi:MAG: AAA family ATPase [Bacteroidaceae bacterium]|nr:AAA family ATPase [Bacteroidaceae bacterium]
MTEIKIKRLSLENFKHHKSLTLEFEGRNASIYGQNSTGKTSIYDALLWLLFGKTSAGNSSMELVKPVDVNGEVKDHLAVTAVEAVLLVNGEELTLRRTCKEVWTTKRGSSEATYSGNASDYYVDGVPCKKNAYQSKINELVDEETFRLLTSVQYFSKGIHWMQRRATLFDVVGVMDDREIMQTDDTFLPLIEGMGKLELGDYQKKLLAKKKGYVGAKTDIPARISECEKTIEDVAGLDFAEAKANVDKLQAAADSVSRQILAIEHNNATEQKRMEIKAAQFELDKLTSENEAYRNAQKNTGADIGVLKSDLAALNARLNTAENRNANEAAYINSLGKKIEASRERWITTNKEMFSDVTCPTCGQALPDDQIKAACERFEAAKQRRLDEILRTADSYKEAKEQAEDRLVKQTEEIQQLGAAILAKEQEIADAEAAVVEPKDMDGYAEPAQAIQTRIDQLNGELHDMMQDSSAIKGKLQWEKQDLLEQIAKWSAVVQKESLLDYSRQRIEELRQEAKDAAACLGAIEKMLFLIEQYNRYKTKFVEDSINGMFRIARFRLVREQPSNGGIEDCCDVVYNGVTYTELNDGMKVNVGIDIINTLSQVYGVTVPLFIDNAESVTGLEKYKSQRIRLVVSETDKELRVNYET